MIAEAAIEFLGRHALPICVAAGVALWGLVEMVRADRLEDQLTSERSQAQARFERQARVYATEAARAADAAASESARRIAAQEAIADDALHQAAKARADAASAVDAAGRLRQRFAAAATRAGCRAAPGNPASAPSGTTAGAAEAAVLSDVLERIADAAGQLARYADESRIAGNACVNAYDSLTKEKP